MQKLVILTGQSGSGVSSSKFVFEELGYYVTENAPKEATETLLDTFATQNVKAGYALLPSLKDSLDVYKVAKKDNRFNVTFIVLTTDKQEILKRYVLSRHVHPRTILDNISLDEAVDKDAKEANELVQIADFSIDTSVLTIKELRTALYNRIANVKENKITTITFMSFGLKNGIPSGIDCLFDVRSIPNPYWVEGLSALNGYDKEVQEYMLSFPITKEVINNIINYLDKALPEVIKSNRANYVIGIACSGGQHRSTFVAKTLADYYKNKYKVSLIHKDSPSLNK